MNDSTLCEERDIRLFFSTRREERDIRLVCSTRRKERYIYDQFAGKLVNESTAIFFIVRQVKLRRSQYVF